MGNDNTVAMTIIEQLGGQRIFAMAFSRAVYDASSVTLHIAPALRRGARGKATHVTVRLNGLDLYDVEVHRCTRAIGTTLNFQANVYADQLRAHVERQTGLALSL